MKSSELTDLVFSKYDKHARESYYDKFKITKPDCKVALVRFDGEKQLLKYILHDSTTVMDLILSVRKNKLIPSHTSLFCIIENDDLKGFLINGNKNFGDIYKEFRREDGLLYINICKEKTFG